MNIEPYYADPHITLYCADAVELIPLLDLTDVTLTFTDPPYNVGLAYSDGDDRADYAEWCATWFALCPRPLVFTPGMVNLAQWYDLEHPQWLCSWVKPNQNSRNGIGGANVWEPILVYGKPPRRVGHDAWVRSISVKHDDSDHPCPKDLKAWRHILSQFADPGALIFDPFAGTGTTLRAAKDHGMRSIGIEIEERWCADIVLRLGQEVLF